MWCNDGVIILKVRSLYKEQVIPLLLLPTHMPTHELTYNGYVSLVPRTWELYTYNLYMFFKATDQILESATGGILHNGDNPHQAAPAS